MDKKYIKHLAIPYMGSKRKLAPKIIDFILDRHPNTKYFYDLFGGGGAISFEAMQRPKIKQVFYNELNTGITELLQKIKKYGITKDFYNWIDRETFNKHNNDDTWFGGVLKTCWSFGNNQKDYLFGKDIENDKRLLHEIVINNCNKSMKEFNSKFELNISSDIFNSNIFSDRRLILTRYIKDNIKSNKLEDISNIVNINGNRFRNMLQQLERLEQLEQLERLQQLEQLEIINKSYIDVEINTLIDETIIYLDPPYADTVQYQHIIDYDVLYKYIKDSKYTIYMSSYDAPFDKVLSIKHNSTLSATHNNIVSENLYCNKGYIKSHKEKIIDRFFN